MLVRAATIDDAPALWRAEVETARTPGHLASLPDELSLASFEKKIQELSPGGCYLVADDDGPLGHAFLDPMPLTATRHVGRLTIVVHPGHTGRGIGTALLQGVQHWVVAQTEIRKIELHVRKTNHGAIGLYKRLGFVEEGVHRDRIRLPDGTFVDDVAMAWFPATAGR